MKKSIYIGALFAALTSTANALPLEVVGKPHSALGTMQTEGRHVEIKEGLRQLIPSEFRTLVHKDVMLPAHINWRAGQDWVSVLEVVARQEHLTFRIDWSRNIVYIERDKDPKPVIEKLTGPTIDDLIRKEQPESKTAEASAQESVQVQGKISASLASQDAAASQAAAINQVAAATQAVSIKPEVSLESNPPQVIRSAEVSSEVKQAPAGVKLDIPKVKVALQEEALPKAAIPSVKLPVPSNEAIQPSDVPMALSLSNLFKTVANAHGAEVINYSSDAKLSSALVAPGLDLAEDLSLIHRALGSNDAPISIKVYRKSDVFEVIPAAPGMARFEVEMRIPYAGPLSKRPLPVYPRN